MAFEHWLSLCKQSDARLPCRPTDVVCLRWSDAASQDATCACTACLRTEGMARDVSLSAYDHRDRQRSALTGHAVMNGWTMCRIPATAPTDVVQNVERGSVSHAASARCKNAAFVALALLSFVANGGFNPPQFASTVATTGFKISQRSPQLSRRRWQAKAQVSRLRWQGFASRLQGCVGR